MPRRQRQPPPAADGNMVSFGLLPTLADLINGTLSQDNALMYMLRQSAIAAQEEANAEHNESIYSNKGNSTRNCASNVQTDAIDEACVAIVRTIKRVDAFLEAMARLEEVSYCMAPQDLLRNLSNEKLAKRMPVGAFEQLASAGQYAPDCDKYKALPGCDGYKRVNKPLSFKKRHPATIENVCKTYRAYQTHLKNQLAWIRKMTCPTSFDAFKRDIVPRIMSHYLVVPMTTHHQTYTCLLCIEPIDVKTTGMYRFGAPLDEHYQCNKDESSVIRPYDTASATPRSFTHQTSCACKDAHYCKECFVKLIWSTSKRLGDTGVSCSICKHSYTWLHDCAHYRWQRKRKATTVHEATTTTMGDDTHEPKEDVPRIRRKRRRRKDVADV